MATTIDDMRASSHDDIRRRRSSCRGTVASPGNLSRDQQVASTISITGGAGHYVHHHQKDQRPHQQVIGLDRTSRAVLVITCIITRRIRGHINDRTMPMQPRKHIRDIQGHASMECVYMYMSPFSCIASNTSYKTMHASQFARMHAPYRQDD